MRSFLYIERFRASCIYRGTRGFCTVWGGRVPLTGEGAKTTGSRLVFASLCDHGTQPRIWFAPSLSNI